MRGHRSVFLIARIAEMSCLSLIVFRVLKVVALLAGRCSLVLLLLSPLLIILLTWQHMAS
jgi:hypothetical protein